MSTTQRDLRRIKQQLLARRTSLQHRHERIGRDLQRRNEPLAADWSERAVQMQNDAALEVIDAATCDELATLDASLERLEQGLYGVCRECGGEIEEARLRALHAVTCAKCAQV